MSYDSYRNKHLLEFEDGRLMLIAEVSCSNVRDWNGKRCWDWVLFHPEGSLFYTKETLKARQKEYVEEQLDMLRNFARYEVENGWAKEYVEPTVDSCNYYGTVWPNGRKVKDGRAFFGGKPVNAEEFVSHWGNPKRIKFVTYDKDMRVKTTESHDMLTNDLDALYFTFERLNGKCYIGIN